MLNVFVYFKKKGYNIKFCGTDSASYFRRSLFGKKKHDRLDCLALAKYRITHDHLTFDGIKFLERIFLEKDCASNGKYLLLSDLVSQYTKKARLISVLKNRIKNIIDLRFPEAIQIFPSDRGCKTILKMLCLSKEDILSGKVKLKKLEELQCKLKKTIGQYDLKVSEFNDYVKETEKLEHEVKDLKKTIKEQLHAKGYSSLFNYKGLDVINIATLVTEIRDIRKFFRFSRNGQLNKKRSLKAFKEFLGIAVTSNQSGEHAGGHKLIRSGNMKLRTIIFMLALTYISMNPKQPSQSEQTNTSSEQFSSHNDLDPLKFRQMFDKFTKENKKMIALTKIMNKISTDLFFVLKNITESHQG